MLGDGRLQRALAGLAAALLLAGGATRQDTPQALRAEAYEAAQWAMASDAADALAKVSARFAEGDDALGRLAERREGLLARRDRLEQEMERLYAVPGDAGGARRAEARRDYDAALAALSQVDAEIEARFPAYSELTRPSPLSVVETQALLGPDEALLLVLVNPEATYVWGVSRERVEWARAADLGEAAMAAAVASLRLSLTTEAARGDPVIDPAVFAGRPVAAYDRAQAHRLYAALVQPVEGVFAGKSVLITVTSGALAALPLAALITEPPTGPDTAPEALTDAAWLIDRYALATLPAVSSLKALRCHLVVDAARRNPACPPRPATVSERPAPRPGLTLAAFGAPALEGAPGQGGRGAATTDSVLGEGRLADVAALRALPALPGSRAELEALNGLYPGALVRMGAEATETAVRRTDAEALSRARFVVFSTHGLLAGSSAGEPGLVLTPPAVATADDDGYLSASEAAGLRLSAEFVVLSACNTAGSDGTPGGEGLSGLARAFFYAGARSVLVSHWEVSDAATTQLITRTFAGLDALGDDPAARARALRDGMLRVRAERRWSHPAYWAAFTLVGAPG